MEGELLSSRLTSLLPEDFSPPLEPQSTNQSASPSPRVEPGDRNVRPALFGKAGPGMRPAMPPGIRPRMPPQAPGAYNSPNAVRPGPRFPPNSYQPRPHSSGAPPRFNPSPGHAPYRPGGTPHRSATSGSQMTQTVVANQTGPRMTPPPLVSSRPPAVGHMTNQSPQFAAAQQTPGVTVANQPPRFTANQTPHRQPAPNSSGGSSHNNNSINQRTMNSSTPAVSGCQKSFSFKTPGSSGQHVGSTKLASPQVDAPVPTANLHFSMPGKPWWHHGMEVLSVLLTLFGSNPPVTSGFSPQRAGVMWSFNVDGLVQERCNSSALAVELRLSCINPSNVFFVLCQNKLLNKQWRSWWFETSLCNTVMQSLKRQVGSQRQRCNYFHLLLICQQPVPVCAIGIGQDPKDK